MCGSRFALWSLPMTEVFRSSSESSVQVTAGGWEEQGRCKMKFSPRTGRCFFWKLEMELVSDLAAYGKYLHGNNVKKPPIKPKHYFPRWILFRGAFLPWNTSHYHIFISCRPANREQIQILTNKLPTASIGNTLNLAKNNQLNCSQTSFRWR